MYPHFDFPDDPMPSCSDVAPLNLRYPQLQELTVFGHVLHSIVNGLNAPKLYKVCLVHSGNVHKVPDSLFRSSRRGLF